MFAAPKSHVVLLAITKLDTTEDEVVPVDSSDIHTVIDSDPVETEAQMTRSEFESQLLAIVIAWCDHLEDGEVRLKPPFTVEEAVNHVNGWADEGLSEVDIASLRRQLDSARVEVSSLTEAVVASGKRERTARHEAFFDGKRIIGRLLVDLLNAVREGELEFWEDLKYMRADVLVVAHWDSQYDKYHTWWCELMQTFYRIRRKLYFRGMGVIGKWLNQQN